MESPGGGLPVVASHGPSWERRVGALTTEQHGQSEIEGTGRKRHAPSPAGWRISWWPLPMPRS